MAQTLAGHHAAERAFARVDTAPNIGRVRIRAEAPFAAMAALVAARAQDTRWHQVHDETFMRWRYASPLHDCRFATIEQNGALLAYAVLERNRSPSANAQRVNLVDWAASDTAAMGEILDACINIARFAELVTWGDTHSALWQTTLQARRFIPIDPAQTARGLPCILLHAVADPPEGASPSDNPADWDVRMIDTSYA